MVRACYTDHVLFVVALAAGHLIVVTFDATPTDAVFFFPHPAVPRVTIIFDLSLLYVSL